MQCLLGVMTVKEKLRGSRPVPKRLLSVCQQLVKLGAAESLPPNFMSLTKNYYVLISSRACFLLVTRITKGLLSSSHLPLRKPCERALSFLTVQMPSLGP